MVSSILSMNLGGFYVENVPYTDEVVTNGRQCLISYGPVTL